MFLAGALGGVLLGLPSAATCQAIEAQAPATAATPVLLASTDAAVARPVGLPDAPGMLTASSSSSSMSSSSSSSTDLDTLFSAPAAGGFGFDQNKGTPNAGGRYSKTVLPGQTAARMSVHDKVVLGIRENISSVSLAGWVISAGYEQATNGSPNYGQTGKGFAQRVGAAAARGSSENIFGDSVLASVLHEDPRYYKLGHGHHFLTRLVYAGTRPIIGKTDGGRTTINFSDLGGDLSGAALTPVYYPSLNRSFNEVLKTFGGSVGGDALGFVVSEFFSDTLHGLHITGSSH